METPAEIAAPLALGIGTACWGALAHELTLAGSLAAGLAVWQLAMVAVVFWRAATATDTPARRR